MRTAKTFAIIGTVNNMTSTSIITVFLMVVVVIIFLVIMF